MFPVRTESVISPQRPALLVDVILTNDRVDSAEMLKRMRALALASEALRGAVNDSSTSVDAEFDADHHIRLETLPNPRSVRELKRLAVRLLDEPFVETRPGWTLHYVEKVARNRSALIVRRLAELDEVIVGAVTGNPTTSATSSSSSGFDYMKLLGAAQSLLMQPDPMNTLIDRGATIAARVMQEFEKPNGRRSALWLNRSGSLAHQDLRIDRASVQRVATRLMVDERSIVLALLADSAARLHRSTPTDSLQCGVATRRHDASRLVDVALPTGEISFDERVLAIHELLVHLPQPSDTATPSLDIGDWIPPALSALIEERRAKSIDLACVFAEPFAPLAALAVGTNAVLPFVSLLGAAVAVIATVDGDVVRVGFSVDQRCGSTAEEVRMAYEESAHTHLGAHVKRRFSRWWATLQRQSTTT